MSNYPISLMEFSDVLRKMDISDISVASIRQCQAVGQEIEGITGEPFVHLEMGIPGINLHDIGVNAQEKALEMGKAVYCVGKAIYAMPGLAENGSQDTLDHFWNDPRLPDKDLLGDFERIVRCRTLVNGNFYHGEGRGIAVQGCARRLLQQ